MTLSANLYNILGVVVYKVLIQPVTNMCIYLYVIIQLFAFIYNVLTFHFRAFIKMRYYNYSINFSNKTLVHRSHLYDLYKILWLSHDIYFSILSILITLIKRVLYINTHVYMNCHE